MNLDEQVIIVEMDIMTYYDQDMKLIPEEKLTKDQKACIKKIDYDRNSIELLDKLDALSNITTIITK